MLHLKVGRLVKQEQQREGQTVKHKQVPVCATPADVLVRDESVHHERRAEGQRQRDVELADGHDAVAVPLLDADVAQFLETGAGAEERARDDHLVDGAGVGADQGADDGDCGARHHEVAPAEDVGQAAADGDENGGAEGPADGYPGRVRVRAEVEREPRTM